MDLRRKKRRSKPPFHENLCNKTDPEFLEVKKIDDYVGHGLFTTESIAVGESKAEHRGEIQDPCNSDDNCYMYRINS